MSYKKILITGGAGFIGSFLTDKLIKEGYNVVVFDNLETQVHSGKLPQYMNKKAAFIKGDVQDYSALRRVVTGVDVVFHLAARVGVGQSNYEIKDYVDTNIGGMANLLSILANEKTSVKKVLIPASMTSYGEGVYVCKAHGKFKMALRSDSQMEKKMWELKCPTCKKNLNPTGTSEEAALDDNSIYSMTKHTQEQLLFFIGKMYRIPVVSLRLFNVYGPRQSLSNPYTGVTAIFMSRLKNNKPPVVFEDGLQSRDFVSVHDVVSALVLAMREPSADYQVFNIGSGKPTSVKEIAILLAKLMKKDILPVVTSEGRKRDIRHCIADIQKAKTILGWMPKTSMEAGLRELIDWSAGEQATDNFEKATKELRSKHLTYAKG